MSEARQKKARKRVDELKNRTRNKPQRVKEHKVTVEKSTTQFLPEIEVKLESLPSRGVPYPKGASIAYMTYSFGEVKKASLSNMGLVQSLKLAMAGVKTVGMDKQQLTIVDALYIGLLRKISSMGGMEFEIPYRCHQCGGRNKARFKHTDMEFEDLKEEVTQLPIEADIDGDTFEFSPITVKQYLDIQSGRYQKILKNGEMDSVAVYAAQVRNFDFEETYERFYSLRDPEDIEVLQEVDILLHHDIKPLETKCTVKHKDNNGNEETCGALNLVKLEGREALLLPFRDGEKTVRNRIRIGSSSESECVPD
jgi:hypothetical protein